MAGGDSVQVIADLQKGVDVLAKIRRIWERTEGNGIKERECRANVLQILLPEFKLADLEKAGIGPGRRTYANILAHVESGGGAFTYNESTGGRKAHAMADDLQSEWVEKSVATRRVNSAGEVVRKILGPIKPMAADIAKKFDVSVATAIKYKPPTVRAGNKQRDLCQFCESLLRARRDLVSAAVALGHDADTVKIEEGQHAAKAPGRTAAAYLRGLDVELPSETASLLNAVDSLEKHESLAEELAANLKKDIASAARARSGVVTIQFDFRSILKLAPWRGDSWDYYNAKKLSILGMACYVGGGRPHFVDIFSPDLHHDAEAAGAALVKGGEYVLNNLVRNRNAVKRLPWWSDCGKHFRNRFLARDILVENFVDVPRVDLQFLGEYHGKSPVDGHFSWIGTCAKNAAADWVDIPADFVQAVKKSLLSAPSHYEVLSTFLNASKAVAQRHILPLLPHVHTTQKGETWSKTKKRQLRLLRTVARSEIKSNFKTARKM